MPCCQTLAASNVTVSDPDLPHRVFVYGTLKSGQPNHWRFSDESLGRIRFLGRGSTLHAYPLIVATRFNLPFLLWKPDHGEVIQGEIYEADDKMLSFLDDFEGHPDIYKRTEVTAKLKKNLEKRTNGTSSTEVKISNVKKQSDIKSNGCSVETSDCRTTLHIKDSGDNTDQLGQSTSVGNSDHDVTNLDQTMRQLRLGAGDDSTTNEREEIIDCWIYAMTSFPPGLLKKDCVGDYDAFSNPDKAYCEEDIDDFGPETIQRALELEC